MKLHVKINKLPPPNDKNSFHFARKKQCSFPALQKAPFGKIIIGNENTPFSGKIISIMIDIIGVEI